MKKICCAALLFGTNRKRIVLLILSVVPAFCFCQNPFITTIYTADPSAHAWSDGRLYVYPSHDVDPARGCDLMDRYHVYSTDDMANWRDEGEILNAGQVVWGRQEGGFMWAPDCAYKNGIYYFYFPHPSDTKWNSSWKIGVATSKKPASDFKSMGYIKGLDSNAMIDPCVFVDTDGSAYFYYGGGSVCKGGKLKDNMVEIDGATKKMEGLVDFHEAAWVFKRAGIYYLAYADNNPKENQLRYATSSSPLGPWMYRGVFLGTTGCDTNHGSVVEYKGKWYAFYHNQSISNTGKGNLRSICVDELNFNDDGSMQLVKQTKAGVPAVKMVKQVSLKSFRYEAENAAVEGSATVSNNILASHGKDVASSGRSFIQFDKIQGTKKDSRFNITIYYSVASYGRMQLVINGIDYSLLNLFPGNEVGEFQKVSFTARLNPGDNNTIKLIGGNGNFNIDYIELSPLD
ncbi:MAG: family 43 glycosylhydrolase [Chitinophagaceae bacterium]